MSRILVVDDRPEQLEPVARGFGGHVLHPGEVDANDLIDVDLFVVDFVLDDWPAREAGNIALLKPLDGRAVIEVIRSHLPDSSRPVGFVLTTAEPDRLARGLTQEKRESVLARLNNLEWVISKDASPADFSAQVAALAAAIETLPKSWPASASNEMREVVSAMLALPASEPWADVGWESVFECHPPIHDLSVSSRGMAFVRWLAHRIIPYPTFLIDEHYLATRLGVTFESLHTGLAEDDRLRSTLDGIKYKGILGDLAGPRWWRSGIEYALWEWTQGDPFSADRVAAALAERSGLRLEPLADPDAVVCLDSELRPSAVCPAADCVRIQPDDWPAFAQPAWAAISLLASGGAPHLRALVVPLDELRLGDVG